MANNKEIDVRRDNSPMDFYDVMPELERMADRFFGDRFGSLLGDWPTISRRTMADVRESDQGYVLSADIPGISNEEIDVKVSGNMLTIHAEHREESGQEDEGRGYRRQYRSFNQSFSLPSNVDPDKIEAHCENGLLEVWIPKTTESQSRKIELKASKGGFLNRLRGKSGTESKARTDQKH